MKKKILTIFLILICIVTMCGCTYYDNYMLIYKENLHTVFGDYKFKDLGKKYDHGYDGLFRHNYYAWEIQYTNSFGELATATIRNDRTFNTQILNIHKEALAYALEKELLRDYIHLEDYEFLTCDFDFGTNYDEYFRYESNSGTKYRIEDYKFFDVTDIDTEKLAYEDFFYVYKILFRVNKDTSLSETEQQEIIESLKEMINDLESYTEVKTVYFIVDDEWIVISE